MSGATDLESFLQVGMVAQLSLTTEHNRIRRCTVVIRGWQKGAYVLLDAPSSDDRIPPLTRDQACAVRFLCEGQACGFESRVLNWDGPALGYVRIAWPDSLQTMSIRRCERIDTALECRLTDYGGATFLGTIRDLSTSGVCVSFSQKTRISIGTYVRVSFQLPNGCAFTDVAAVVRNLGVNTHVGCEFTALSEGERQDIDFYVSTILEARRSTPSPADWALVLEPDRDTGPAIDEAVELSRIPMKVARRLVDCFYRLRVSPPEALLISSACTDLRLADIVRLIRGTHDLAALPIFVYGALTPEVEAELQSAGVTKCLSGIRALGVVDRHIRPAPQYFT